MALQAGLYVSLMLPAEELFIQKGQSPCMIALPVQPHSHWHTTTAMSVWFYYCIIQYKAWHANDAVLAHKLTVGLDELRGAPLSAWLSQLHTQVCVHMAFQRSQVIGMWLP